MRRVEADRLDARGMKRITACPADNLMAAGGAVDGDDRVGGRFAHSGQTLSRRRGRRCVRHPDLDRNTEAQEGSRRLADQLDMIKLPSCFRGDFGKTGTAGMGLRVRDWRAN
jgi:hypothetical protein